MSLLNSTIVDRKKQNHALELKLNAINRAKKADMRMHDNMKQRFRNKYGLTEQQRKHPNTVADIRMFESHCPGFCYHRDGRARFTSATNSVTNESRSIQELSNLLFTNGELDMDKVLCLHLLSSHHCETLKPPQKQYRAMSAYVRDQSPLEKLIERSKKYTCQNKHQLAKKLPTYVLNVKSRSPYEAYDPEPRHKRCLIRDGRLATRLLINNDIKKLIEVILEALQSTNPDKMKELLNRSRNPELLKNMFAKPEICEFVNMLGGFKFLTCCDSFHLSRPFKSATPLNVDCGVGSIDKLVTEIRQNVLRSPSNSPPRRTKKIKEKSCGPKPIFQRFQIENGNSLILTQRCFDVHTFAVLLRDKIREAHDRDMREFEKSLHYEEDREAESVDEEKISVLTEESVTSTKKSLCRRSMCIACQEKWKQPLPRYQYVARKKSNKKLSKELMKSVLSNSTHVLTVLINDEMEKMKQRRCAERREKASQLDVGSDRSTKMDYHSAKTRGNYQAHQKAANDASAIDSLNLAKIKHAISAKENKKRVQKFLDHPISN